MTRIEQLKLNGKLPSPKGVALAIMEISRREDARAAAQGALDRKLVETFATEASLATEVLRHRAALLDRQASRLRLLAQATHEQRVIADLAQGLSAEEHQVDLFRAGLLLAKLDNEEVEIEAYGEELERMGRELAAKLPAEATETVKLDTLRKYLFEENGFHGSRGDYSNRANSYLNEVLDDREGLPITLSVVYLELARRIGLNVVGVGLPGHFVVRHVPAQGEPQLIDVYDGATALSREEAARRVQEASGQELSDEHLMTMTKRAIISRMLNNLLGVSPNDPRAMHRYLNALLAIEPDHGQYHWLRAVVRYRLEEREAALEDVSWILEKKPEGVDFGRVFELQQALERPR